MALPVAYTTGTVSIGNGSTTLAGVGTAWLTAGVQAGDYFWAAGLRVRVLTVNSNTSITLAFPWPGAALAGANYEIQFTPDATRVLASTRSLLESLTNGNISALAGLATAADRLAYYTGAGTAALATLTAGGRAILGLTGANGKFPVWTAAGTAAARDIVGTVAQFGGIPTGAIMERGSNANGEYTRFADGTQICKHAFSGIDISLAYGPLFRSDIMSWTYPAQFTGTPQVTSTANSAVMFGTGLGSGGISGQFSLIYSTTAPGRAAVATAIGRWF